MASQRYAYSLHASCTPRIYLKDSPPLLASTGVGVTCIIHHQPKKAGGPQVCRRDGSPTALSATHRAIPRHPCAECIASCASV